MPCHFTSLLYWKTARTGLLLALLVGFTLPVRADTLTVAVASNFAETLATLAARFEQQSGHQIRIVRGSSGRHYAQIVNGAPFDLFFSADARRPGELVSRLALPNDRLQTYALGRLVVWALADKGGEAVQARLTALQFATLAMANPRLAPYGQAAEEALQALGLADRIAAGPIRLVRGENVAQAYQYVATGNAQLGFVALSQVLAAGGGAYWVVPEQLYQPIVQQLVLLRDSAAGRDFLTYLASPAARSLIESAGYGLP